MFRSFFFPESAMAGSLPYSASLNPPRYRYRFLILGAGIHGLYLANLLLGEAGVSPDSLLMVDDHETPMAAWRRVTAAVGMLRLRSTSVHHLDPDPVSLRSFYTARVPSYPHAYGAPYNRPSLRLFNDHARASAVASGAAERLHTGRCTAIERLEGGYRLTVDGARIEADNLILALGQGKVRIPAWRTELGAAFRVTHLFSPTYDPVAWRQAARRGERILIVGAGISAMQAAVSLASAAAEPLTVLALHYLRVRQFDSDPGWIGPRYLSRYAAIGDPEQRRDLLRQARYPGSGDPEAVEAFLSLVDQGKINFSSLEEGELLPRLTRSCESPATEILLATGYEAARPGGELIDSLVDTGTLPVAAGGYPVLNPYLAWAPGLFVLGALGELELGPVARNISGARRGGERIFRLLTDYGEISR